MVSRLPHSAKSREGGVCVRFTCGVVTLVPTWVPAAQRSATPLDKGASGILSGTPPPYPACQEERGSTHLLDVTRASSRGQSARRARPAAGTTQASQRAPASRGRPQGPWRLWVPESHGHWRQAPEQGGSVPATGTGPHSHAPAGEARTLSSSQSRGRLSTELTASSSASADLVAGGENLFSPTKLITAGRRSPGAPPNPHQCARSRSSRDPGPRSALSLPLPAFPRGDIPPPASHAFPPSADTGLTQGLAWTPPRCLWECPENGTLAPASCPKGWTRKAAASPVCQLSLGRLRCFQGFPREGGWQ